MVPNSNRVLRESSPSEASLCSSSAARTATAEDSSEECATGKATATNTRVRIVDMEENCILDDQLLLLELE